MICKRVIYTGQVQGIGFRYTTRNLAGGYALAGFVRNLRDGTVEVVAEGAADQVDAFLAAVAERMAGYIENTAVQEETPKGMKGFSVRH